MDRRRFLRNVSLGGLVAWFAAMPAVASTVESAVQALSDIRDVALGPGDPLDKLDAIVAIVDGEIGSLTPTISGDFAGTIPAGETWKITGDVNLTGDLIVEGTLTGVDTFTIEGNGHQILFQNGGRSDLAGKPKTAWVNAGDAVTGWEAGDQLMVAPTAVGDYSPKEAIWGGDWASTVILSDDVTLVDGSTARPEVANLSQTARIHNVSRIMFHHMAGVQSLSSVAVVDSGVESLLDHYPIHFHNAGDSVRGSTLTDVVVVGGRNHAFVPHSSHGITLTRCAAINVTDQAYWWNDGDFTHDLLLNRPLVLGNRSTPQGAGHRNTGFKLGRGNGNQAIGAVAVGVLGTKASGGFLWPEADSDDFPVMDCVAHNNQYAGLIHYHPRGDVDGFVSYRNGGSGISQLAYASAAVFSDLVASENGGRSIFTRGVSWIRLGSFGAFRDVAADGGLTIGASSAEGEDFVEMESAGSFTDVSVEDPHFLWRFVDCGLSPSDFSFRYTPKSESVLSIVEDGVEVHRFEANTWVS